MNAFWIFPKNAPFGARSRQNKYIMALKVTYEKSCQPEMDSCLKIVPKGGPLDKFDNQNYRRGMIRDHKTPDFEWKTLKLVPSDFFAKKIPKL